MKAAECLLTDVPELPRGARLWLAYSGGLDSTLLLHALHARGLPVTAVHVHHGLQAAAEGWARHCRAQCRSLKIPLRVLRVQVCARGKGVEAAAREARHAALQGLMRAGDVLVTAHHRGDQAETVLLRLLRGSGVTGLAAMRALEPYGPGRIWRPLLECSRAALEVQARAQGLRWIEDPHNADPRYARSYLRTRVMPLLDAHWPAAEAALARHAAQAAEAQQLLDALAREDEARVRQGEGLRVSALLALDVPRRHNLLRHWLRTHGLAAPDADTLARISREILAARVDASPRLSLGALELRRYRDQLHLLPPLPPPPEGEWRWERGRRWVLPAGLGELRVAAGTHPQWTLRFARGGERIQLDGEPYHRSLKTLFQQAGVPPWERLRTPLLFRQQRLIAVGTRWRSSDGPVLEWRPP